MRLASAALATTVAALARTWRLEVEGEEDIQRARRKGTPLVFAVWHAHLLAPLWHRRSEPITLLVSGHRDAEYLARAATSWGYSVVRGSSSRGQVGAVRGMIRSLGSGSDLAFTPDGPRGPARRVKPGTVAVARRGGAALVPVGVRASAGWRLRSWDRFLVPAPLARIRIVYRQPFTVREADLRTAASRLQAELLAADHQATW